MHSAGLAERAQELRAFCRYGSSLPQRVSELAIIMTAAHWRACYEWHAHANRRRSRHRWRDNRVRERLVLEKSDEQAVHAFVSELLEKRRVSDETYSRARSELGERRVVDLVGILGCYALISMTIVAFAVIVPDAVTEPFA